MEEKLTSFSQNVIRSLIKTQTKAKKLPQGTDYKFFNSFSEFKNTNLNLKNRIDNTLDKLCKFIQPNTNYKDEKESFQRLEVNIIFLFSLGFLDEKKNSKIIF